MGSTPNTSIKCNRCRCTVSQEDRYTHNCQALYQEEKKSNEAKTIQKNKINEATKICKFCRKNIKITEYEDHIICHNLNNENEVNNSESPEILNHNGHHYKIVYSVNLRNVSNNSNNRHNRVQISVPSINSTQRISSSNNLTEQNLQQLNSIRNITNLLRQLNNNINFDSELQNNKINQLLDYLPESTLENISKLPEDKKSCVICLSNYEIGEKVMTIPCYHIFHTQCIKCWFKTKNTCPICKFKLDKTSLNFD